MNWDQKKWGTVAALLAAIGVVLGLFPENVRILLTVVLILLVVIVCFVIAIKKSLESIKQRKFVKPVKVGFIFRLLTQIIVAGIFVSTISFLFSDNIPVALGEVIKDKGTEIAKKTEECILECIREKNEKVMITLADSEEVRNVIYGDALYQAQDEGYIIQDIKGRYHTPESWVKVPFTITKDKILGGKRLVLIRLKNEGNVIGDREKVPLHLGNVIEHSNVKLRPQEFGFKSVFLTEDERRIINNCFEKYEGQDLYGLMYSVLNDPNMIEELRRKKAYDVEYYELRLPGKDKPIAKGEKKVKLSNSYIIIKKTTKHLTPYHKTGIIGCYIDELR